MLAAIVTDFYDFYFKDKKKAASSKKKKKKTFSSSPTFSESYFAVSVYENDAKRQKQIFSSHPKPEIWTKKIAVSRKNGHVFVTDF